MTEQENRVPPNHDKKPVRMSASPAIRWPRVLRVLFLAWALGSFISCGLIWRRCLRFRAVLKSAIPADVELTENVVSLSQQLGLKRVPAVVLLEARIPPLVWGIVRRPRIVLPRKLFEQLSISQRQTVLAHELAHIKRRDHIFRWIEVAAHVFYWWCPLSWWAIKELRRAEEECCDALVVWAFPASRQSYGQALFKTAEFLMGSPLRIPAVAGGAMSAQPLKRRIELIMNRNIKHRMSWKGWLAILLIAAATLPVLAQTKDPEKQAEQSKPRVKPSTEETAPISNRQHPPP